MRQPYLFESDRMGVTNLSPFDKIMPALFIAELNASSVSFLNIITLLRSFNILKEKDIDIISRIQAYFNRSIQNGSSFDRLIA
jgi:hypothetical protein